MSCFRQELIKGFGGPRHGLHELRRRVGAPARALTCSALKPQGLSPAKLADLALRFARGGVDYIKDDHGLADQAYSPFRERVEAVAAALRTVAPAGDRAVRYAPSLAGDLDAMREPDRRRPPCRRRYRHDRADDLGPVQLSPAGAGKSRSRLRRPSHHGGGGADRARVPAGHVVPHPRGRCRGLPELWRTLRLLPRYLRGARAGGPGRAATACAPAFRCRPAA